MGNQLAVEVINIQPVVILFGQFNIIPPFSVLPDSDIVTPDDNRMQQ